MQTEKQKRIHNCCVPHIKYFFISTTLILGILSLSCASGKNQTISEYTHPTVFEPVTDGISLIPHDAVDHGGSMPSGVLDITKSPFNADSTGRTDSTKAINKAINFARESQMVAFFPEGRYLVSDTLDCAQGFYMRSTGAIHQARHYPCVLRGSRKGARPQIILKKKSAGFQDVNSPRPVVKIWSRGGLYTDDTTHNDHVGAVSMNQMIVNIDIKVEESNPGAVGVEMYGAQGTGIEEVSIDVTHGHTGIVGATGSGGSIIDVEIKGGQIGLDFRKGQPVPTVTYSKLVGQTQSAVIYSGRQTLTMVGCEIISDSVFPVIQGPKRIKQPHWGQMSIIDTTFEIASDEVGIIDTKSSLTLHDVYVKANKAFVKVGSKTFSLEHSKKWTHIIELAYGVAPAKRQGFAYAAPIYVDGKRLSVPKFKSGEADRYPDDIHSRHIWSGSAPSWEGPDTIDVTEAPYNAKGNGVADDTKAIQMALDTGKTIFLPKGYYKISKTLEINRHTNLIGVAKHLSVLIADRSFKVDSTGSPLVRVVSKDPDSNTLMSVGLFVPKSVTNVYALDWSASSSSVVRDISVMSKYIGGYRSPEIKKKHVRNIPLVKVAGGGKWYNLHQEDPYSQGKDYRHLYVYGANKKLAFYQLNLEHGRGDCNSEVRDSSNIEIFSLKGEGNFPILCIYDSKNIKLYGFGGNASAFIDDALIKIGRSSSVLMTNLVNHHRPVGKGSYESFAGKSTNPKKWSILEYVGPQGNAVYVQPLDRPVLLVYN